MDAFSTFHLFTNLPSELRIKIWNCTIPEPRVVSVRYNRVTEQYTTTSAPSPLLHICSESRSIFLSIYTNLILSPKYPSAIFVDFASDTIFFDSLECSPEGDLASDLARSPHREKILFCAIDAQLWEVLRVFRYDSLSEVRLMPNLKTIALVMPREYDRGLQQRATRMDTLGRETAFIEVDSNTVQAEIRHIHWYVESLRWELENGLERFWGAGKPPNVQMWLW